MAFFKPWGDNQDNLTNQLLQLSQWYSGQVARKQASYDNLYKEFGQGIEGLYDDTQLSRRKNQFDKYYADNKANMSGDTLAKYELLDQQFKNQEELNREFKEGMHKMESTGKDVQDALIGYSDINLDDKLTEDEKNELRKEQKDAIQTSVNDYTTWSGNFTNRHGQRLGSAGYRDEATHISNLKEMFAFGIVQAKDDFLLDDSEANALTMGIELGSNQPIIDYRANEESRNSSLDKLQEKQMVDIYDNLAINQKYTAKAANYFQVVEIANNEKGDYTKEEQAKAQKELAELSKSSFYTDEEEGIEYTYEGLLSPDSQEAALLKSAMEAVETGYTKLENIESIYERRKGLGYLESINIDPTIKDKVESIYRPGPVKPEYTKEEEIRAQEYIDKGFKPDDTINMKAYKALGGKYSPDDPTDPTDPKHEFIKEGVDVDKIVSQAKPWAAPELKKRGEKINKIKQEIDNWTLNFHPQVINEILGRDSDSPVSYNDIKGLKIQYEKDITRMNVLNEKFRHMRKFGIGKDDPRLDEIKKEFSLLNYKWRRESREPGRKVESSARPSPTSPLSILRISEDQIGIKDEEYNRLFSEYQEDIKNTKK